MASICPVKKLSELTVSISTGLNPRANFKLNDVGAVNYYVTVKEIAKNRLIFSESTDKINDEALEIIQRRSHLAKGDVLFSGIGTIGKVVYVDIDTNNWNCSESVFIIKPNKSVNGKYLSFILQSNYVTSQYNACAAGAIMKGVRKQTLENLQIPLPSLSEQQRIVDILDKFEGMVENVEKELLLRQKQYEVYREKMIDDLLDMSELLLLGNCCEIKGRIGFRGYTREDQVQKGNGAISLSPGNIIDSHMDYTDCTYITWVKYNESPEIMVFENDIILCKTASVGKIALIKDLPCKSTINPQLVVLKNISINSKFLFYILDSERLQNEIKALAGIGSVPNVSQAKLNNIKIPVPPLAKQQEIVAKLDKFEEMISTLKRELELRKKQYEYYREKLLTFE